MSFDGWVLCVVGWIVLNLVVSTTILNGVVEGSRPLTDLNWRGLVFVPWFFVWRHRKDNPRTKREEPLAAMGSLRDAWKYCPTQCVFTILGVAGLVAWLCTGVVLWPGASILIVTQSVGAVAFVRQGRRRAARIAAQSSLAVWPTISGGYYTIGVADTTPKAPLPTRKQDEPFVGWKQAKIVVADGKLCFEAYNGRRYGLEATAECVKTNGLTVVSFVWTGGSGFNAVPAHQIDEAPAEHAAPHENCHCGFYAFSEKPAALEDPAINSGDLGDAMLQVELFGKVIVAKKGYRAERMRVLSVEFSRTCARCTGIADGIHVGTDLRLRPGCSNCVPLGLAGLAEMAGLLGTEVKWLAPPALSTGETAA